MSNNFQPYDGELLAAFKIVEVLERRKGTATDMEAFRQEAIDRFHRVGLLVDVKTFSTNVPGTYSFDIEIIDRINNAAEFDHDRMVHEVTNDILELGTKGTIKATKADVQSALDIERSHKDHG